MKTEEETNKNTQQKNDLKSYNKDQEVNINMNNSGNTNKDDEFESY